MPTVQMRHAHSMSPEDTKQKVEHWAKKLERKFGVSCTWASERCLDVAGKGMSKGVKAQVNLEDKLLAIRIELPFLMAVMKPAVEKMMSDILKRDFV